MEYVLPTITIQQMVTFVTVVEEDGFAHASYILHMTQSAVSKSVAKLERELGIQLFIRTTRYLELTKPGRLLYEEWKIQLSALQHSYELALRMQQEQNRVLKIGLLNTARPERYFSAIMRDFSEHHPEITAEIESQYMTDLLLMLEKGNLDLIILPDFARFSVEKAKLNWQYAARGHAQLLMSKHHTLAKRDKLSTKDLKGMKFVTVSAFGSDEDYRKDLCERLAPYGIVPDVAYVFKTAYDIRYLFRPDEAVLMADEYFDYPEDGADFVRIPIMDQENGLICAWSPRNINPGINAFLDVLPEYD